MKLAGVTLDHLYTCYKNVGTPVPTDLLSSVRDTARHKGWLEASDTNAISVTVGGENHVEHDLPRAPVSE